MISIELELIIIGLLIFLNGLLSFSEMSVITTDKLKIKKLFDDGNKAAKSLIDLLNHPSKFLSSIQIGITLVGVFAGAFGGATIAEELETYFVGVAFIGSYAELISVVLVVLGITFLSILFGELIPKKLALSNPEKYALLVSSPIKFVMNLFLPFVSMFSWMTDKIVSSFSLGIERKKNISKEYLKNVIEQGAEEGSLTETEQDFIYNFLILDKIKIDTIMTQRGDVIYFDINDESSDLESKALEYNYDFYPLCDESLDNVIGIIESKEFFKRTLWEKDKDIRSLAKNPLFVPEKVSALQLLESFRKYHLTIALVVDEFGGVEGIISLNDILNSFFFELQVFRGGEKEIVRQDENIYILEGSVSIQKIKDLLGFEHLPDEGKFNTLAGFIMAMLQKIPSKNDILLFEGFKFEISNMIKNRIGKVKITKI